MLDRPLEEDIPEKAADSGKQETESHHECSQTKKNWRHNIDRYRGGVSDAQKVLVQQASRSDYWASVNGPAGDAQTLFFFFFIHSCSGGVKI